MTADNPIIAYKGFSDDWTCRDFQYAVGETYEHAGEIKACQSGFHACTHPLDVFAYYPPAGSRFAVVEVSGETSDDSDDTKVSAAKITIKTEIQIGEMIEAAVKAVFGAAKTIKGLTFANDKKKALLLKRLGKLHGACKENVKK